MNPFDHRGLLIEDEIEATKLPLNPSSNTKSNNMKILNCSSLAALALIGMSSLHAAPITILDADFQTINKVGSGGAITVNTSLLAAGAVTFNISPTAGGAFGGAQSLTFSDSSTASMPTGNVLYLDGWKGSGAVTIRNLGSLGSSFLGAQLAPAATTTVSLSQAFALSLVANSTYTLTIDTIGGTYGAGRSGTMELWAGATQVATQALSLGAATNTLVYNTDASPIAGSLSIKFTATGGPSASGVFFLDNATLNVVPEPTTWALLAFSLTAVTVLRRRNRRG